MLFEATIRKELAKGFGATLVVLLTIVVTMMLIRMLGLAANGAADPRDVVLLLGYTMLGHLPTIIALSMFIAVVVGLGRMYRDSEMVIWFASGAGLGRFVRPVLRFAVPLVLLVGLLSLFLWPWGNQQIAEMRKRYEQRSDVSRVAPGSFQVSKDGNRVFFVEREAEAGGTGRSVFLLGRDGTRESVTTAHSGRVETRGGDRLLVLDAGHRNETFSDTGEHGQTSFERYQMVVDKARAAAAQAVAPKTMSTLALIQAGTAPHQAELTWRVGLLFGALNLTMLGIGMAATNPRRASNWNLLFALLTFVVYYNLLNLSQAWVASGRLQMVPALAWLHGSAFLFASALIWWRDHATTLGMPMRLANSGGAR